MMTEIIIGMAGEGRRFVEAGFRQPKPFVDVSGLPMISRVIHNLLPISTCFTFITQRAHVDRLESLIHNQRLALSLDYRVIGVSPTQGAACTVLELKNMLVPEVPVLIAACDQIIDYDIQAWKDHLAEGNNHSSWVFAPASHPKWSYCKVEDGRVIQVAEKQPISQIANCGVYYWNRWDSYVRAAERMIDLDLRVNGEFYVAPVLQQNIEMGEIVRPFYPRRMQGLGTPEDLEAFIASRGWASS